MARDHRRKGPPDHGGQRRHGRSGAAKRTKRRTLPVGMPRYKDAWTIILNAGKATTVIAGHPWVYSGAIEFAIAPMTGEAVPGQACVILDHRGFYLGFGYYNAESQIAVRLVALATSDEPPKTAPKMNELVAAHLAAAWQLRDQIGVITPQRGAWRLCNGAGDGLPGCSIDRYADGAVVVVSTAGAAVWLDTIVAWLTKHGGCAWVVCRAPVDAHPSEVLAKGILRLDGSVPDRVDVDHHGVTMPLMPRDGAKSGLFTDQWDNHLAVAALCDGRYVLDAYCHTGGFGLHAAKAGAVKVLCVDASQRACDLAQEAAERAGLPQIEVQCADAVHALRNIADGFGSADAARPSVVIVDPPKFATAGARVEDALRKYTHLNATALAALADEGWLVSCSCSGRIDDKTFLRMLAHAARRAGRQLSLVEFRSAGRDHPTAPAHDEGRYLKVAICRTRIR
jgi:23S rRNA (cytosine1962-C5)-methyltransferase